MANRGRRAMCAAIRWSILSPPVFKLWVSVDRLSEWLSLCGSSQSQNLSILGPRRVPHSLTEATTLFRLRRRAVEHPASHLN